MGSHKLGNIEHIQNIDGKIRSIEFLLHQIRAIIVYFVTFNIFKFLSSENERIQKLKFERKVNCYTVINKNNVQFSDTRIYDMLKIVVKMLDLKLFFIF